MNLEKEKFQKEVRSLVNHYNRIVLSIATGVGKSLIALMMAKEKGGKWFILVNETPGIDTWKDEIKKFGYEDLDVEIFCYQSLHKYQYSKVTGIICDEAHHLTESRVEHIKTIQYEYIVGLSATLPVDTKNYLNYSFGNFYEFKYSLSQGIADNFLPEPIINIVGIDLTDKPVTHIIQKGKADKRKFFQCSFNDRLRYITSYPDLCLEVMCTEKQKYAMIESQVNFLRDNYLQRYEEINEKYTGAERHKKLSQVEFFKTKWLLEGSVRKRFIADLKTESARLILEKIKDKKLICFTGSINQANKIAFSKELIVNSEKGKLQNQKIIANFNEGIVKSLFVTGMLKEGMNLSGIEAGLIVQLDNQTKSLIQMLGRVLRSSSPVCYILYVKDTQDEKYLKTALTGFDKKYINYLNINEI